MAYGPKPRGLVERCVGKYEVAENGCWNWTAANDGHGYGAIWYMGRVDKAHRAMYMECVGDIPAGMDLCHSCDNRACINPAHMFVGTRKDNMADCTRKGRFPKGEKSHKAKLNLATAVLIREDARTYREIAAEYGISQATITSIKKYGAWS